MNNLETNLTFPVPLTKEARQIAEKFRRQQSNPEKGERVYRNTLAVYAVDFYCRCMGIDTELEASDSWDAVMQTLTDVADLELTNLGKLECRPVLKAADFVEIPFDVWSDSQRDSYSPSGPGYEENASRLGYIAVELDESMREATLVGFVKEVAMEKIPLSEWRSLEDFLEHIETLQKESAKYVETLHITSPHQTSVKEPAKHLETLHQEPAKLSNWLHQVFDTGWESVEMLLGQQHPELAYNFRSPANLQSQISDIPQGGVKRGKFIDLQRQDERVALFVGLTPATEPEIDIWVEVCAAGNQTYLPPDLQLAILDEGGEEVMQARSKNHRSSQARSTTTKNIQLQFSGEIGERFSVKVALGNVIFTEAFLI